MSVKWNKQCPRCGDKVHTRQKQCPCGYVFYGTIPGVKAFYNKPETPVVVDVIPTKEKLEPLLREIRSIQLQILSLESELLRKEVLFREGVARILNNER